MIQPIISNLLDDVVLGVVESDERAFVGALEPLVSLDPPLAMANPRVASDVPEGWRLFHDVGSDTWYIDRYTFIRGLEERTVTLNGTLSEDQLPTPIYGLFWERNAAGRWAQQISPWYRTTFSSGRIPAWVLGGSALATPNAALPFAARLPRPEIQDPVGPAFDVYTSYIASSMPEGDLPEPMDGYVWSLRALNIHDGMWIQVAHE